MEAASLPKVISGWLGTILSLFFFISPITLFIQMFKSKRNISDIPLHPIVCNSLNCLLWFCYGLRLLEIQMIVCNVIGGLISLIWLFIYIVYYTNKSISKIIIHFSWIIISIVIIIYGSFLTKSPDLVGYFAMLVNVLMYAAPGLKIVEVIKTQKYTLIPISMSIIGALCSLAWTCFGISISKISAIIPNVLGIVLSLIQIFVWGYYYKLHHINLQKLYNQAGEDSNQSPVKQVTGHVN